MGFWGVHKESACLIWGYHFGNIQFAIFHIFAGIFLFNIVQEMESISADEECSSVIPQDTAGYQQAFQECTQEWNSRQDHAPWLLFWWCITSMPLFALQIYAGFL